MQQTVEFEKNARNIFFHLLTKCNLSCRHCYINPAQHGHETLSLKIIEERLGLLIDSKQKPSNIIFLGGEPTLHPELAQAIKTARQLGCESITIDTNGYLFHDILNKTSPDEVDYVSFSLDGPTSLVNDPIRGNGSYKTCVKGIKKARAMGYTTSAIYTVGAYNIEHLEKMPELLSDLGIKRFFIQVLGIRGKAAKGQEKGQGVTRKAWLNTVPRAAGKAAALGITTIYPKVWLDKGEKFECAGKVAENYFVFPNGRVYHCPLCEDYPIHAMEFKDGKLIKQKGLHEGRFFDLDIPEGCVMNKLVQSGSIEYDDMGKPQHQVACCLLKEKVMP